MSAQTYDSFDSTRAEAFAERLADVLNGGALSLMISIGHRVGLFDVMGGLGAATSQRIAREAGLHERYVREWLGAMVTSAIVEYDPPSRSYRLPREHAASLTRAARPANMAVTAQWIPVLATVEDELLGCFENGGGVPYSSYQRFHAVMAEESDQSVVAALVEEILPLAGVVGALQEGIDVLDVGCGSGRALNEMARAFPKSRFTGYDLSAEAIGAAKAEARQDGLGNARFEVRDLAEVDVPEAFDLVTAFDAIHDQAAPARVLAAVARTLRPRGTFLMQDIAGSSHVERDVEHPMAPFLYTISCMHCMTVSLAAGGEGLGAMWGEAKAREMLAEAGFQDLEVKSLPHDLLNLYYVSRKAA